MKEQFHLQLLGVGLDVGSGIVSWYAVGRGLVFRSGKGIGSATGVGVGMGVGPGIGVGSGIG